MKYKTNELKLSGFTLIELLVVVMIIGMLATLISVNVINSAAKSRDAKRSADINSVKTALGQYYEDYGEYPACNPSVNPCILNNSNMTALRPFLSTLPIDPKTKFGYEYTRNNAYSYQIKIVYEVKDGCTGTACTCYTGVGVTTGLNVCK